MTDRFRLTIGQLNATVGDLPGNAAKARSYLKWRDPARGEHLQVISVINFKGGSRLRQ